MLELIFGIGLITTAGAVASAQLLSTVDDVRAEGAVRYLATRLQQIRMESVARSADVALQFVSANGGYMYAAYVDGNGNGVRTVEIQDGTDPRIADRERLSDRYRGVEFGLLPGLPPVDPGGAVPGSDPIKLGSSNILTFTAIGNSSSGSLYVLGPRKQQFVVRISGETGKTRVLRFDAGTQRWKPL